MYEEWGKEAVSSPRNGSCRSTETNEYAFALMVGWMRCVWIGRDGMGNGILAGVFVTKRTNQGAIPTKSGANCAHDQHEGAARLDARGTAVRHQWIG